MTGEELRRRLGFTTQTFVNSINTKGIFTAEAVRWAAGQGFTWVEVRDKNQDQQLVIIVFNNNVEPLYGDGFNYFGITELLEYNPEMKLAFDPANFLNK